jgi:3,4-dihydroxyphenylacetate 2,3-dioxygenase
VFIASSALTHALVRGRHHWPVPERVEADRHFIAQLKRGEIAAATGEFGEYSRKVVAEMGGRALATMLGVAGAMADGAHLEGRQYGEYAQSSGSGNANLLLCPADTLATIQ